MSRRWRAAVLVVAALGLGVTLAGCGASGSANSITLYSGQHVQTTQSLVAAFKKATGIQVNVRSDGENTLADQIVTEGSNSPADVIFAENSPSLEFLQGRGMLGPVTPSTLAQVPSQYNSSKGDWVGVSTRVSVIIYNPSRIAASQLPTTVLQLADPRYTDKIAIAAAETDFQPIITSVAHTYGRAAAVAWLKGIASNAGSRAYPDNETVANEVNRGSVAFGVIDQYYWYRMQAEIGKSKMHSQLAYFAPHDPGYVIDVSGAAVLKSSGHAANAKRFLAFLVSRQGQQIIAHSTSFEYPIAPGVTTAQPETPFSQLQPNPISIAELGDGSNAIELLKQAGLL